MLMKKILQKLQGQFSISFLLKKFKRKFPRYIKRVGIAFSIFINVVLGGHSGQTFSARNHQWKKDKKYNIVFLIDIIIFWDRDHCMHSWVYWRTGRNVRKVTAYQEQDFTYHTN